jgi:hypothetical protein
MARVTTEWEHECEEDCDWYLRAPRSSIQRPIAEWLSHVIVSPFGLQWSGIL